MSRCKVLLYRREFLLGNTVALLVLEVQAPLAQPVYTNPEFARYLGLGLIANRGNRTASSLNPRVWCLRSWRSMTQTS